MSVYPIPNLPLQPSNVWYAAYTINADEELQLYWPSTYANLPNVAASQMDITWDADSSVLYLPDATSVSVGQTFIITNVGDVDGLIRGFGEPGAGFEYLLPSGATLRLYLQDSSTQVGTWGATYLSQTNSLVASVLQGEGLLAAPSLNPPYYQVLNTNSPVILLGDDFMVGAVHRSKVLVFSQPITATLMDEAPSNGFSFIVYNQSLLAATIACPVGSTINGSAYFTINGQSSVTVVAGAESTWYAIQDTSDPLSLGGVFALTVAAASTYMTSNQSAYQTLIVTGELTENSTVYFYPLGTAGWNVLNATTGAFTLSLGMHDGDGTPVGETYLQGQDTSWRYYAIPNEMGGAGPGLFKVPTIEGTTVEFNDGTAGAPSITFTNANTTGFYLVDDDPEPVLGLTVAGTATASFAADITTFLTNVELPGVYTLSVPQLTFTQTGSDANPVLNFSDSPGTGLSLGGDTLSISATGTNIASFNATSININRPIYSVVGGTALGPDYSFYTQPSTGMYASDAPNAVNFSVGGTAVLSLTNTGAMSATPLGLYNGGLGSSAAPVAAGYTPVSASVSTTSWQKAPFNQKVYATAYNTPADNVTLFSNTFTKVATNTNILIEGLIYVKVASATTLNWAFTVSSGVIVGNSTAIAVGTNLLALPIMAQWTDATLGTHNFSVLLTTATGIVSITVNGSNTSFLKLSEYVP